MKLPTIFQKKPETKSINIDIGEAFTLWDVLNSKYMALEKLYVTKPLIKDPDLLLLFIKMEKELNTNIKVLQQQMKEYNIISPNKSRVSANFTMNSDIISDEFISLEMLLYEQEHIENLLLSIYSLVTNDTVRGKVTDMLFRTVDAADQLMKFMTLKGWIGIPPAYKNLPPDNTERIHCGEASSLWDLLIYRYDTLHFTNIMLSVVNDLDFKIILEAGNKSLEKQVGQLEKEMLFFGIPVPRRPSDITVSLNNTDVWEDSHIFRMVLMGMQGAGTMHIRALKKFTVSNRIRSLIRSLLCQEVEKIDDLLRYGKLKGWLHGVPAFGP